MKLSSDLRLAQPIRTASHVDWNHLYDSTDKRGRHSLGAKVGLGAFLLGWRTDDRLVEIKFTTGAGYGSFLTAEPFGSSGVLATMTTGLVLGCKAHFRNCSLRNLNARRGQRSMRFPLRSLDHSASRGNTPGDQ